jgi:hypothetical protein
LRLTIVEATPLAPPDRLRTHSPNSAGNLPLPLLLLQFPSVLPILKTVFAAEGSNGSSSFTPQLSPCLAVAAANWQLDFLLH